MNYQVILNDQVNIIISNVEYIEIKNEFVSFHDERGKYVAGFKLEGITGFFTMDQPALDIDTGEIKIDTPINIEFPIDTKTFANNLRNIARQLNEKFGKKEPSGHELLQEGLREEPPEETKSKSKEFHGRLKITPEQWQEMRDGLGKVNKPPEWEEEARKDFNVQMNEIYRKAKNAHQSGTITTRDIWAEMNEIFKEGLNRGGIHPMGSSYHYYVRKLIKDKLMRMKGLKKNDKYHFMYDRFEEALAKNMEECLYGIQ